MAIAVNYFQFGGVAFKPENISFGDGESLEVKINSGTSITTVPLVKRTATLTAEGMTADKVIALQTKRDSNINGLLSGQSDGVDLDFGGYKIEKTLLTKVTPSGPISIAGKTIFETVELEYSSQVFA